MPSRLNHRLEELVKTTFGKKEKSWIIQGAYNRSFSLALRQAKFYLLWQPSVPE